MSTISNPEQLALLLNLLGEEATEVALASLDGEFSQPVKAALEEFKAQPPTQEEIEYVIDDFEKYFQFAIKTIGNDDEQAHREPPEEHPILQIAEEHFDVSMEPVKKFSKPELTGNLIHDLNRMHPYQVAYAIRNDSPITIAAVIRHLATEHAAKTLEFLPDPVRPNIFLQLAAPSHLSQAVVDKILEQTLKEALLVEERQPDEDRAGQMVMLLRTLPKNVRIPMLDELMKTDADLGSTVKSQLYQFEDLIRLTDRDMQKVLGQSNTDSLVLALQNADQKLIDRVLNNMSKRARETLQEEMEFKTNANEDDIAVGRAEIVATLVELEESGGISLE